MAPSAESDALCLHCHPVPKGMSHPTGVFLGVDPGALPVDGGGRVRCKTCHGNPFAEDGSHYADGATAGLRKPLPTLCETCHDRGSQDAFSQHGSNLGRAHISPEAPPGHAVSAGLLDRESNLCLSCHDGSAASGGGLRTSWAGRRSVNHPVGIEYAERISIGRAPQLRPASSLPPQMRLFDGKIGCGTCHNLFSRNDFKLVVDNHRSRLCLTCHIK